MSDHRTEVLDHGYVQLVEAWGFDERIVEAARMSTAKGFLGWGPRATGTPCFPNGEPSGKPREALPDYLVEVWRANGCPSYQDATNPYADVHEEPGDEKLLKYLWDNQHQTPFEMAGLTIEVKAPIFVFREWMRHRVPFGYNEMSSRYVPLPDENYIPSVERLMMSGGSNKQAKGTGAALTEDAARAWRAGLASVYEGAQSAYEHALLLGVPKELARICLPVGRYSVMRATGNLRGWLAFLKLRRAPGAQWEIREYANVVAELIHVSFPHTYAVAEGSILGGTK